MLRPARCSVGRQLVLVVLAVILVGCGGGAQEEVPVNDTTTELAVFDLQFDHPDSLEVQSESDAGTRFCFSDELMHRHTRCLEFSIDGQIDDVDYQTVELVSGGTLNYVNEVSPGGSGGPIHVLNGHLEIDGQIVFVEADAAEAAGYDDATWVVPILETVRR